MPALTTNPTTTATAPTTKPHKWVPVFEHVHPVYVNMTTGELIGQLTTVTKFASLKEKANGKPDIQLKQRCVNCKARRRKTWSLTPLPEDPTAFTFTETTAAETLCSS